MMQARRFGMILILAVLLIGFAASRAYAQASFLFGLGAGMLLGSGGDGTTVAAAGATVIYGTPRVSERVKDPLGIKFASISVRPVSEDLGNGSFRLSKDVGITLFAMFARVEKNPERYEVLQVVRIFDGQYPYIAAFWFSYVPKESVIPLEQLPSMKK